MSLVVLGSAKSCGVTTAGLALAAVWPHRQPAVLAELDPSGGDVACWYGVPYRPGLVSWAAASRNRPGPQRSPATHLRTLPGGLAAVLAPPSARAARGAVRLLSAPDNPAIDQARRDVLLVADCGRLDPDSPARPLTQCADLVVVVTRPTLADVAHLPDLLADLPADPARLRLLVTAAGPYDPAEVAAAVSIPLLGVLPHDPRGAAVLAGAPSTRAPLWRLPLVAAATRTADALGHILDDFAPRRHLAAVQQSSPAVRAPAGRR
ncbi:MAG: hypothetical protein L0Y54_18860 [Sporichthyaceae bacterium]|nr:hypothetical protein [Sporichthyaceae bacterium]